MTATDTMIRRPLPATAGEYEGNAGRAAADPIGLRGLPDDREGVDGLKKGLKIEMLDYSAVKGLKEVEK